MGWSGMIGRGPAAGHNRCPVSGCGRRVVGTLMCRADWLLLPWMIRGWVWATWRSGTGTDTPEHQFAVLVAVAVVNAIRKARQDAITTA